MKKNIQIFILSMAIMLFTIPIFAQNEVSACMISVNGASEGFPGPAFEGMAILTVEAGDYNIIQRVISDDGQVWIQIDHPQPIATETWLLYNELERSEDCNDSIASTMSTADIVLTDSIYEGAFSEQGQVLCTDDANEVADVAEVFGSLDIGLMIRDISESGITVEGVENPVDMLTRNEIGVYSVTLQQEYDGDDRTFDVGLFVVPTSAASVTGMRTISYPVEDDVSCTEYYSFTARIPVDSLESGTYVTTYTEQYHQLCNSFEDFYDILDSVDSLTFEFEDVSIDGETITTDGGDNILTLNASRNYVTAPFIDSDETGQVVSTMTITLTSETGFSGQFTVEYMLDDGEICIDVRPFTAVKSS